MNKEKKDLTSVIIATIISLLTIITVAGTFISKQTELQVQLTNIEKELTNINIKLDKRDDEIKDLTERIIRLESK